MRPAILGQAIGSTYDAVSDKIRQSKEQYAQQAGTSRLIADRADHNQKTYSFSDVQAALVLPFKPRNGQSSKIDLPGLVLLSWSEHRDTYPVVSAGRRGIKGYTSGHSIIGGTVGFNMPGKDPFQDAIAGYCSWVGKPAQAEIYTKVNELPPMDFNIVFHDKFGNAAAVVIRGLKIVDSSYNLSVQDVQYSSAFAFEAASASNITSLASEDAIQRFQSGRLNYIEERQFEDPWKFFNGNGGTNIKITSGVPTSQQVDDFFMRKLPP